MLLCSAVCITGWLIWIFAMPATGYPGSNLWTVKAER
jgi:hypothetical protein